MNSRELFKFSTQKISNLKLKKDLAGYIQKNYTKPKFCTTVHKKSHSKINISDGQLKFTIFHKKFAKNKK